MPPQEEDTGRELREYLDILRRRRAVIVIAALVVIATALVASFLQTPVYQGKARILFQSRSTESLFDPKTGQRTDPDREVQTEIEVLKSQPVRNAVREKLGSAPKVTVVPVGQTDVIEVRARRTNAADAAAVANAYANGYIDFRRSQAVNDLLAAGNEIQAKIADLQRLIDTSDPRAPDRREALVQQQALFKQKLDQLQVDAALKTGGAQLVTPAAAPRSPVEPAPKRTAALALFMGAVFGVGIAFLLEYLDDSIKDKDDLERAAHGLPSLGLIPAVAGWKDRQRPVAVSVSDPKSPAAEAYRSLRTSIQFLGLDRPLRTIQVSSPSAGEGKTTTIANLGVALAEAGERVVIVSCDLRRPRLHEFFQLSNEVGFTSVLLGDVPVSSATRQVDGIDRLRLVAAGPVPPNPSELLASRRAVEAIAALQAQADIVLIDSPPILPVADTAVLSNRVDGTILVASVGRTTRRDLHRAHEVLRQVDARLIGTVLNGVTGDAAYGYAYGYAYAYADAEPNGRKRRLAVKS